MPEYKVHQLWPKPIFDTEIPVKQQWLDFAYNSEYERVFIDNADYTKDKYVLNKLPDLKNLILDQEIAYKHLINILNGELKQIVELIKESKRSRVQYL